MHILRIILLQFLRYWKGEFVDGAPSNIDHCLYSNDLNAWLTSNIVRRHLMLVTASYSQGLKGMMYHNKTDLIPPKLSSILMHLTHFICNKFS